MFARLQRDPLPSVGGSAGRLEPDLADWLTRAECRPAREIGRPHGPGFCRHHTRIALRQVPRAPPLPINIDSKVEAQEEVLPASTTAPTTAPTTPPTTPPTTDPTTASTTPLTTALIAPTTATQRLAAALVPGQSFDLDQLLLNKDDQEVRAVFSELYGGCSSFLFYIEDRRMCEGCLVCFVDTLRQAPPMGLSGCVMMTAGRSAGGCAACTAYAESCDNYPRPTGADHCLRLDLSHGMWRQEEERSMVRLVTHWGFDRWHDLRGNRPSLVLAALEDWWPRWQQQQQQQQQQQGGYTWSHSSHHRSIDTTDGISTDKSIGI